MPYENKAFEEIYEYRLRKRDLSHLDPQLQAGILLLCHATNETNVAARLFLGSFHEHTGNEIIDSRITIQQNYLLRSWIAKTYEIYYLVNSKPSKYSKTEWGVIAGEIRNSMEFMGKEPIRLAENIRNEVANHYDLNAAIKNVKHLPDNTQLDFHFHKNIGNTLIPAGETAMYLGRIMRHTDGKNLDDHFSMVSDWLDWNYKSNAAINNIFYRTLLTYIIHKLPNTKARQKTMFIPFSMVGNTDSPYIPLFSKLK